MPLPAYDTPEAHLRRSQSVLSVGGRPKHHFTPKSVDPEILQQHALIAANIAMERSLVSPSETLSRENSKRSMIMETRQNNHFAPKGLQMPQFETPQIQGSPVWKKGPMPHENPSPYIPPAYEPVIMTSKDKTMNACYSVQSSSYRRLRKAKSMMDTRKFGERTYSTRTGGPKSNFTRSLQHASSSMSLRAPSLRLSLQRSFNMLRSHSRRSQKLIPYQPELTCRPESIALARSEFLKLSSAITPHGEGSPQTPKSTAKNSLRSLRKSVRTGQSPQNIKEFQSLQITTSSPLVSQSISASLRNKIRRVFGKSASGRQSIPPQQPDASTQHFALDLDASDSRDAFDSYYDNNPETSRRNSFYIPSEINHGAVLVDYDPPVKSNCTEGTNSTRSSSQSRITSWNNSLASSSLRGDVYDPKRLSVIREDGGPHQPSSSAGRHVGGISALQQPLQLGQGAKIDSQRVYSALLKRIDREHAKVKQTQAALQDIHGTREDAFQDESSTATVRRVHSDSSFTGMSNHGDTCSIQSADSQPETQGTPSLKYKSTSRRPLRQHRSQEQSSTFFGASTGMEPPKPSPFGKLLREHRSSNEHRSQSAGIVEARISKAPSYDTFANSSDSVYSRTTNGGTNLDYSSPLGSSENFEPYIKAEEQRLGVASVMYSNYTRQDPDPATMGRTITSGSMTASEKGQWRGWMENQVAHLDKDSSLRKRHVRELTQVDPCDVAVGSLQATSCITSPHNQQPLSYLTSTDARIAKPQTNSSSSSFTKAKRHLMIPNKQERSFAVRCDFDTEELSAPKAPLARFNGQGEHYPSANPPDDHRHDIGRKLSANHLAKVLRLRRSQPTLISHQSAGKENKPNPELYVTPTKGRDSRRPELRSTATDQGLQESKSNTMVRRDPNRVSPSGQTHDTAEPTPTNRTKATLAARLSRPFDMDIPEFNRPFDSTYLGQSSQPPSQAVIMARLSVAPHGRLMRAAKSYGGLGIPNLAAVPSVSDDLSPTALPQLRDDNDQARTTSIGTLAFSSKRIVSNFLRSRRKRSQTMEMALGTTPSGSSIFI